MIHGLVTYANATLDPETFVDPGRLGTCPVLTRLFPSLYVGGVLHGMPLPLNVEHLISLFPSQMYALSHPLRSLLLVPMEDRDDGLPDAPVLKGLGAWVNVCRGDAPTVVHCQAGLNRAPLVVAIALIQTGMSPSAAIASLREARDPKVLFRASFEAWLIDNAEYLRS